jgi:hypothetical protein
MVASSAVDLRFEAQSIQTKDNKKKVFVALRRKSNQDNVFEWSDISICGMLFQ